VKMSATASAKLAEHMQKGWTMLGHHCPVCNCPLMLKKPDTRKFCVNCESEVLTQEEYAKRQLAASAPTAHDSMQKKEPKQSLPQHQDSKPSAKEVVENVDEEKEEIEDDGIWSTWRKQTREELEREREAEKISNALSDRMLRGWAMLEFHCCKCKTVLLRSREGTTFCVGCNTERSLEGDDDSEKESEEKSEEKSEDKKTEEIRVFEVSPRPEEPSSGPATRSDTKIASHNKKTDIATSSNSETTRSLQDVVEMTIQALKGKLWEANEKLRGSRNMRETIAVTNLIRELAEALEALQKVEVF